MSILVSNNQMNIKDGEGFKPVVISGGGSANRVRLHTDGDAIYADSEYSTIVTYNEIATYLEDENTDVEMVYCLINFLYPTFDQKLEGTIGDTAIEFANVFKIDGKAYGMRVIVNSNDEVKYEEEELVLKSELQEEIAMIENELTGSNELSFTWVSGSFNPTTGKETSSAGTWMRNTEFIEATNDTLELIQANNIRSIMYEYERPDLDTYIAGAQAKAYDGNSVVNVVKGHFYRIASRINGQTGITPEMCPTIKIAIKRLDKLDAEVNALHEEIETITGGNVLTGKTVYAIGDSITYGANNNAVSYITKVANRNNMNLTNLAISGSTWVLTPKTSGDTPSDSATEYRGLIPDEVTQMLTLNEPNYVILSGGFNDAQRTVVNTVGEVQTPSSASQNYSCYQDNFDTNTFAGAIEHSIYQIKQSFPNAKLLYVITYRKTYEFNWEMTYAPVIRQICEKWAIPYVDFTREGNMICNSNLTSSTNIFTDGTHPNDEGYQRMSVLVESKLKEI